RRTRTAEVGVRVIDAGVDDGHLHAFAAHAVDTRPGQRRLDPGNADDVLVLVSGHRLHVDNAGKGPKRGKLGRGDAHLDSAHRALVAADDAAAERLDGGARVALFRPAPGLDRVLFLTREAAPRRFLQIGDGRPGENRDDGHRLLTHAARQKLRLDAAGRRGWL